MVITNSKGVCEGGEVTPNVMLFKAPSGMFMRHRHRATFNSRGQRAGTLDELRTDAWMGEMSSVVRDQRQVVARCVCCQV